MLSLKRRIALLALFLFTLIPGQFAFAAGAGPVFKYTHPTYKFQIKIPKSWVTTLTTGTLKQDQNLVMTAEEYVGSGGYIGVEVYKDAASFDAAISEFRDGLGNTFGDYKLMRDEKYAVKGARAHLFLVNYTDNEEPQMEQILTMKKGAYFYRITASAHGSDWERLEPVFLKSIKSFVLPKK